MSLVLKSEQKDIAKKLAAIDHDIEMHNTTFAEIKENLKAALDLVEDCGVAYRAASLHVKRLLNQAIFTCFKLYDDDGIKIEPELASPFEEILSISKMDNISADAQGQKNTYSNFSHFLI